MPVVNGNGTLIKERDLSPYERAMIRLVREFEYPRDYDILGIMPYDVVRLWLYSLGPRQALIYSGDQAIQMLLDAKRKEGPVRIFLNYVRRMWRGYRF